MTFGRSARLGSEQLRRSGGLCRQFRSTACRLRGLVSHSGGGVALVEYRDNLIRSHRAAEFDFTNGGVVGALQAIAAGSLLFGVYAANPLVAQPIVAR